MKHPLERTLNSVGVQAHWLMVLHGICCVLLCGVTAGLLVGLVDYLLHIQDRGIRLICSVVVLLATAWAVRRYLYPALRSRPSVLDVAQRVEGHFPQLRDRLASTIEFLQQSEDDATAGSASLRRAVIAETTNRVEHLELKGTLDFRRTVRITSAALCIFLVPLTLLLIDSGSTLLVAKRLVRPLGADAWNQLEFVRGPNRIALGGDLEVELVDRHGRLPGAVTFHYWFDGDPESRIQSAEMQRVGDRMVYRLSGVIRPFRYRARGGDDHAMAWSEVEVMQPPQVASVQIQMHPPEYTGWATEVASSSRLVALAGTRLDADGLATLPLSAARLKVQNDEGLEEIEAIVADNGLRFHLPANSTDPWIVSQPGFYWFELKGLHDLRNDHRTRWEIRPVQHGAPTVSLDQPDAFLQVTPDARLRLEGNVADLLAIHWIQLRYHRSDQSDQPEKVIELFRGPPRVAAAPSSGIHQLSEQADRREIQFDWDLSTLDQLRPGTQIVFHLAAANYKPLENQSTSHRLSIITPDQLHERFAQRRTWLLGQIAEVLEQQRISRNQAGALEIQLDETGVFSKTEVDQLQSVEMVQSEVKRRLVGDHDGVLSQLDSLLDEMRQNRVDSPGMERRLVTLIAKIAHIGRESLPWLEHELIGALKIAQSGLHSRPDSEIPVRPDDEQQTPTANSLTEELQEQLLGSLHEVGQQQEQVIATLERILEDLSKWDSYRRFERQISQLRNDQADVTQRTMQLQALMLTRPTANSPDTQDRVDHLKLAKMQFELARRLEKIQGQMDRMQSELHNTDPLAAQTLDDALTLSRNRGIGSQMRDSGRQIENDRAGRSVTAQKDVAHNLDDMLDTLANRREHESGRLLQKLRHAADELNTLDAAQDNLQTQLDQAGAEQDEVQRQMKLQRNSRQLWDTQKELERLSRQLRRLQAPHTAESVSQGASRIGLSAQSGENGNVAAALEELRRGDREIELAKKTLGDTIRTLEQELLHQQLKRLEQDIGGMRDQQHTLLQRTKQYQQLRQQHGRWDRGQAAGVAVLAGQQRGLVDDADVFARRIQLARTFYFGLERAVDVMQRAANRLDRLDTGSSCQRAQESAINRLDILLTALRPDEGSESDPADPSQGDGGGNDESTPEQFTTMAELKLLKLMQRAINVRTDELEESRVRNGELNPEAEEELTDLTQQQGMLAELVFDLLEPTADRKDGVKDE